MTASLVESLRQPEYTGENRCTPCTIANSVIAVVGSVALAGGLVAAGVGSGVAAGVGLVALALSAASIYLRGYLVPYTPTLTKRYFPDWLLAKFDKLPADADADAAHDSEIDPEAVLRDVGAVEPCADVDDLCLSADFRDAWRAAMDAVEGEGVDTDDIVRVLDLDETLGDEATLNRHGTGVLLTAGTSELGKWESDAALVADVGAAAVLADRYPDWTALDPADRSRLLRGLRIFAESCPLCDGPIQLGQHTVESCCRSYDVVAVTCDDCQSRLFEQRADQVAAAD